MEGKHTGELRQFARIVGALIVLTGYRQRLLRKTC